MIRHLRLAALARKLVPIEAALPVTDRAPLVRLAEDPMRCRCPECLALDVMHPGEGYQLFLFPYEISRSLT